MLVGVFLGATGIVQAAPDLQPDIDMTTIAVVITVIALLLAFFFLMGGVKYVTPENVLDTEIRKNLYGTWMSTREVICVRSLGSLI